MPQIMLGQDNQMEMNMTFFDNMMLHHQWHHCIFFSQNNQNKVQYWHWYWHHMMPMA